MKRIGRSDSLNLHGFIIEDIGIDIDYCLRKITVEAYLSVLPVPQ